MKKCNEKLIFASAVMAGTVMSVTGCGNVNVPMGAVYGPPEMYGIEDSTESEVPETDVREENNTSDETSSEEQEYNPELVYTYYSDDELVSIVQDYNTDTSVIVDGDEEIPVDIAMGVYGPRIMKCDIDGDGEDEYVISECEGTGTGFSVRGLCIVEKVDDTYKLTKYDGNYFAQIIAERISYTYDAESRVLTVSIINENGPVVYVEGLEGEDDLEDIVWTDQIGVYFEDGKVYMSAASGLIFKDHGWPEYEQAVEPYAQITVDTDSSITVGDFTVVPDDGLKD